MAVRNILTNTACEKSSYKEKPYKLSDYDGLFLLVSKSKRWKGRGSKRWIYRYLFNKKENQMSLGSFPDVSLEQARAKRNELKKLISAGKNPAASQNNITAGAVETTFEIVANQWLDNQVKGGKRDEKWKQRQLQLLNHDVLNSPLSKKQIRDIVASDLSEIISSIEARGAFTISTRILTLFNNIFEYSLSKGYCEKNVTIGLKKGLIVKETVSHPAVTEKQLPELLWKIDQNYCKASMVTILALKILALTFVRQSELKGMRWDEIEPEKNLWIVPAERMKGRKDHVVPLSPQTIVLLEKLKRINHASEYCFAGNSKAKPFARNNMNDALNNAGYKDIHCPHGFRVIASTILHGNRQFREKAIELQLSHVERNRSRAPYDRAELLDERWAIMKWYADYLDVALAGYKPLSVVA